MLFLAIVVGILATFGLAICIRARKKLMRRTVRASDSPPIRAAAQRGTTSRLYTVVAPDQALVEPYPYVLIEKDGVARELHASEREYLQTPFDPFDGARPSVKTHYEDKNGWGDLNGFLERAEVPASVPIRPAPYADPRICLSREEQIQLIRKRGFDVTENADGSFTATRPASQEERKLIVN
jgi:hypothetical protein